MTRASLRGALAVVVLLALATPSPVHAATKPIPPNTISFWNSQRGLTGGGSPYFNSPGKISLTTDGGHTFRTVLRTDGGVIWLDTAGTRDAWAVVKANSEDQYLLHTGDGGETWETVLPWVTEWSPAFASPRIGLAVTGAEAYDDFSGNTKFVATNDGGATWERRPSPCPSNAESALVTMASAERSWAMCMFDAGIGMQGKMVYRTTDGGDHWERLVNVKFGDCDAGMCSLGYPVGMSFSHGLGFMWQSGEFGYLTRTGGRHWSLAREVRLAYSASVVSSQTGFVLTYSHHGIRLVKTDDAGHGWSDVHHWKRAAPE